MKDLLCDHRSSLMAMHASRVSLVALAVVAIGMLFGFGAVELYETANSWVLRA